MGIPSFAGSAKDSWNELVGKQYSKRPEFALVKNDPSLPNVLIYGDSISIGYTQRVRNNLNNKANVYRIYCNGGPSSSFINKMKLMHTTMQNATLDEPWTFKWDVVHFNVGLHDLKYTLNGKLDKNGKQVSSIDSYKRKLDQIVAYLKELSPDGKLIFATTTPVPEGAAGRFVGDSVKYNEAALEVMGNYPEITINDLYTLTKPKQPVWWRRPGDVHYNDEGKNAQGDQVTKVIQGFDAKIPAAK